MAKTTALTAELAKAKLEQEIRDAHERYERRLQRIAEAEEQHSKPVVFTSGLDYSRYERAYNLRKTGMSLAAVGKEIGVSGDRIRQMVSWWERRLTRDQIYREMSYRTINILKRLLATTSEITPAIVAEKITIQDMRDAQYSGKHAINETRAWLNKHGLDLRRA